MKDIGLPVIQRLRLNVVYTVQDGQKMMCWAGVIEGQLIIHWFDNNVSVNGQTYLDMLKEKVWPKIRTNLLVSAGWSSYTHYKRCTGMVEQHFSWSCYQ